MAREGGGRPEQGEPVLDRAFALLRAFTVERTELNLTELATRSALPLSTARRLAARLVALGALERTPHRRYIIGVRMWEIAMLSPRGPGLRVAAMPYLEDLYEVTHQHVLLAIRDGAEAVLVERISGHSAVEVMYNIGGRLPLLTTGVGRVLLAHSDSQFQEKTVQHAEDPELRTDLANIRRQGVCIYRPGPPWPLVSVAAPIYDHASAVNGALSIIVPEPPAQNPRHLVGAVRMAARGISRSMRNPG
ncbi:MULTISPECIES: IclR family transcriptional regulator [Mycolicibacterium]|nr:MULTISPECIES: IclR family transcriptional regulator [Mycolicibacterium]MDR7287899.1 DNA-binding IclR family transcriptional regulator [Mycolicibacterium senegalense]QZA24904.1 IclR family transcriptional regulator [Mycolicibacterium senegalense]